MEFAPPYFGRLSILGETPGGGNAITKYLKAHFSEIAIKTDAENGRAILAFAMIGKNGGFGIV